MKNIVKTIIMCMLLISCLPSRVVHASNQNSDYLENFKNKYKETSFYQYEPKNTRNSILIESSVAAYKDSEYIFE